MRLEQWSHIRNDIKQERNLLGSLLDEMEEGKTMNQRLECYPQYPEINNMWIKFDEIVKHMDDDFTVSQIEEINYWFISRNLV